MKKSFGFKARRAQAADARMERLEREDPDSALVHYADIGHLAKVRQLIQAGAQVDAKVMVDITVDTVTQTPLYAAAGNGHLAVVQALVQAGATVDLAVDDGWTPLVQAAMSGWSNVVKYLAVQGANVNHREQDWGATALHKATRMGRPVTVEYLLAAGADDTLRDNAGHTAEETICEQFGGSTTEKAELTRLVRAAFDQHRAQLAAAAEAARAAEAAYARSIAEVATLQQDMRVRKPLHIKPVRKKP